MSFNFNLISCSFMLNKGKQLKAAQYPLGIQKVLIAQDLLCVEVAQIQMK
jgi:hypothetical protein